MADADLIVKSERNPFSIISYDAITDTRLSVEARGVYCYMVAKSNIPGFELWVSSIKKECGLGEKKYLRIMKELKQNGYVEYHIRTHGYKKIKTEILVRDTARTDGIHTIFHDKFGIPVKTNLDLEKNKEDEDDEPYYI